MIGLTAHQLQKHMELSLRTVQSDIATMKRLFSDNFLKGKAYRIPLNVLQNHYGFDRAEMIAILDQERAEKLAELTRTMTAAEIAVIINQPYKHIVPIVARMKADRPDICPATSPRIPVELIRVYIASNIQELIPAAIAAAAHRDTIQEVISCNVCRGNMRFCPEHKPYQTLFTTQTTIKVTEAWQRNAQARQLNVFDQLDQNYKV